MKRTTILAVGAAGQFAGLAVAALSQRGARVRGLVRNAEQGNEARRLGAAEVVVGDLRDLRSLDAALAGLEDRLLYGTFELCADGALNREDVAKLIADVIGREIRAIRIDPATLGEESIAMQPMFAHYDHDDLLENSLTLRAILGREPRPLRAYFEERDRKSERATPAPHGASAARARLSSRSCGRPYSGRGRTEHLALHVEAH